MTSGKLTLSGFVTSGKLTLREDGRGPYGDLKWIFGPDPFIFPPFSESTAHALRYGHRKFGSDWMYIRGEWVLRRWHWRGPPTTDFFRKHMPSGMGTESLGVIGCIFAENGNQVSLEDGITHSKVGNDQMHIRGEMTSGKLAEKTAGVLKWIFGPIPFIFESPLPFYAQQSWGDRLAC